MKLPPILAQLERTLLPIDAPPPTDGPASLGIAAVLLLLFPRGEDMYLLLTERPTALRRHAGQVSLPGGAVEALDGSLWQTALRETREELGIRTGRLRPLGRLDTITISASNYLVTPFVAWNPVAPALRPDPREVARVIEMPLRALLDPSTVVEERWELRGSEWYVTCYRFDSVLVWGATARILHDFTVRIHGNPDPNRPPPGSVRPV